MQTLVEREINYDDKAEVQNSLLNSYPRSLFATAPQQITILSSAHIQHSFPGF